MKFKTLSATFDLVAKATLLAVILATLLGFSADRTIATVLGLSLMYYGGYKMEGRMDMFKLTRFGLYPFFAMFIIGMLLTLVSLTIIF